MNKGRLEAFSDAVIAIIVTIMILEFKTPETAEMKAYWKMHHTSSLIS
nr:TMEM175 family protein [Latilactobacillus sakei]